MSNAARHRAIVAGVTLGVYQAHAIFGGIGAMVMLALGHDVIALIFGVGSVIGWLGWKRDFGLRIRAGEEKWKP